MIRSNSTYLFHRRAPRDGRSLDPLLPMHTLSGGFLLTIGFFSFARVCSLARSLAVAAAPRGGGGGHFDYELQVLHRSTARDGRA